MVLSSLIVILRGKNALVMTSFPCCSITSVVMSASVLDDVVAKEGTGSVDCDTSEVGKLIVLNSVTFGVVLSSEVACDE